jgi:Uncharacterised nucleotidyltransferase
VFKQPDTKLENWFAFQNICKIFSGTSTQTDLQNCNWEKIVALSSQHLVAPGLFMNLAEQTVVPDDVKQYFLTMRDMNANRLRIQAAGLRDIVLAMRRRQIEPVLLKGAANLVSETYSDKSARFMGDIDLIVPTSQHAAAFDVLMALGYQADQDAPDWKSQIEHHEEMVMHPDTGLGIELHRAIAPAWLQKLLPADAFLSRSGKVNFEGQNYRVLCLEDRIIHCIVHAQLHHDLDLVGGVSLRALFDLKSMVDSAALSGTVIDWVSILEHFKKNGHLNVLAGQMNICAKYLNVKIPVALLKTPSTEKKLIKWLSTNRKSNALSRIYFQFLLDKKHLFQQPHRAMRIFTPSAWLKRWNILKSSAQK